VARLVRFGRSGRVERVEILAHRTRLGLAIRGPRFGHAVPWQALVAARVGVDLTAVHRRALAGHKARLGAAAHDLLEQSAEHVAVAEAVVPVLAEGAVVWHGAVQAETAEPAMGQVEVDLGAELPFRADAAQVADQQHAGHQLGINRGPPDRAVVGRHDTADERCIEQGIDGAQRVVGRHMVLNPERVKQRFRHHPLAHHRRLHRTVEISESRHLPRSNVYRQSFFNSIYRFMGSSMHCAARSCCLIRRGNLSKLVRMFCLKLCPRKALSRGREFGREIRLNCWKGPVSLVVPDPMPLICECAGQLRIKL
jgi:hypothetical protein